MKTYLRTIIGESQYREDLAEAFVAPGARRWPFSSARGGEIQPAPALTGLLSG
jgi:hypothetical protein